MNVAERIYSTYKNSKTNRLHLGASSIGQSCLRSVWYQWRWALSPSFSGRILRLFQTGHEQEARLIADLKAAGYIVEEKDSNGKQFSFDAVNGHFKGSCDGFITIDGEKHLLEIKTHNEKSFTALEKNGVFKEKLQHVAQMMIYMHFFGIKKALYLAINKNDESIYHEIIHYDETAVFSIIEAAEKLITAEHVPDRISNNPTWYECKMCDFYEICHGEKIPNANCRTCAHVTAVDQGQWKCERHNSTVPTKYQNDGCGEHIYIPPLIPKREVIDMVDYTVNYGDFSNGKNGMASKDMAGKTVTEITHGVPF